MQEEQLCVQHFNGRWSSRTKYTSFWNDETRMWLNWEKYRDPVVQLTLLPNKGLLEETVPYYLLGLKPPEQTLGRAGI